MFHEHCSEAYSSASWVNSSTDFTETAARDMAVTLIWDTSAIGKSQKEPQGSSYKLGLGEMWG